MSAQSEFLRGHQLEVYSTVWCPDCNRLKTWLGQNEIRFSEVNIDDDPGAATRLEQETGKRGVPYILLDNRIWVRGYHTEERSRLDTDLLLRELQQALVS